MSEHPDHTLLFLSKTNIYFKKKKRMNIHIYLNSFNLIIIVIITVVIHHKFSVSFYPKGGEVLVYQKWVVVQKISNDQLDLILAYILWLRLNLCLHHQL